VPRVQQRGGGPEIVPFDPRLGRHTSGGPPPWPGSWTADTPYCGPLNTEHKQILFGDQGRNIDSAALILLRIDDQADVLAIGSRDPECFITDLGTDLLDRMGEITSQKLRGP